MLGNLSIAGAVAAILMIPTAPRRCRSRCRRSGDDLARLAILHAQIAAIRPRRTRAFPDLVKAALARRGIRGFKPELRKAPRPIRRAHRFARRMRWCSRSSTATVG